MRRCLQLIPLLSLALGACDALIGVCTQIGCESGREIVLGRAPQGPCRVEAFVDFYGPRYVYECSAAGGCTDRIFFAAFTPDRAMVRVIGAEGIEQYEVAPSYREFRPNGSRCPPICRTAVVRLPSDRLGR